MAELTERKERLLGLIIDHFIQTAEPIGSKFLAENTDLGLSGATLRNEMRGLENGGFLTHPHTSAGRIPTERGYRYYIENIMKPVLPSKKVQKAIINEKKRGTNHIKRIKAVAKYIAPHGNCAVIISFDAGSIYYTGISNLFSQPEFRDFGRTMSVSAMFDQCEERVQHLYNLINGDGARVLLGNENPLGNACGLVFIKFRGNGLFMILGPMRMDYGRTVGLLEFVGTIL